MKGSPSASVSGTAIVAITMTWNPANGDADADPPPPSICLIESSAATSSGDGGGAPPVGTVSPGGGGTPPPAPAAATINVNADNGLNDGELTTVDGTKQTATSSTSATPDGYNWYTVSSGKVTIMHTISVAASSSVNGPGNVSVSADLGTYSLSIHATPYNFHQDIPAAADNTGTMYFDYAWSSTSGDLNDLGSCYEHEFVTYPGYTGTGNGSLYIPIPCFSHPAGYWNPTNTPGPGDLGNPMTHGTVADINYAWGTAPTYMATTVDAPQEFHYDDLALDEYEILIPSVTGDNSGVIHREVEWLNGQWWYHATKRGLPAWGPIGN